METYIPPTATQPPGPEAPGRALTEAQELGKTQLSTQKDKLAEALESVSQMLRQGSQTLQQQGQQSLGQGAQMGADRAQQISQYLRQTDASEIVGKVRQTARQRPVLVAGSGFLLAVIGGRLVKSLGQQLQPEEPPPADTAGDEQAPPEMEQPFQDAEEGATAPRRPRSAVE